MDQVLLSFGFLVMQYQQLSDEPVAQKAIIDSLELRWKKADQELFIASVLVNPFYRAEPFAAIRIMNIAGICALLTRVWKRLSNSMGNVAPPHFVEYISDFLRGMGRFQDLAAQLQAETLQAERVSRQFSQPLPVLILYFTRTNGSWIPLRCSEAFVIPPNQHRNSLHLHAASSPFQQIQHHANGCSVYLGIFLQNCGQGFRLKTLQA
jgi:hypothetical protein